MASIEGLKIIDGDVYGAVSTNKVGSRCIFPVCSVEEWEELSDEASQKMLLDAAFESGQVEIYLLGEEDMG